MSIQLVSNFILLLFNLSTLDGGFSKSLYYNMVLVLSWIKLFYAAYLKNDPMLPKVPF